MHPILKVLGLLLFVCVLSGCKKKTSAGEPATDPAEEEKPLLKISVVQPLATRNPRLCANSDESPSRIASAPFEARSGSKLVGWAEFLECNDGVHVEIRAARLQPRPRAVHIHEIGDCSDPRAHTAGTRFNPELGDLGNAEAKDDITIGVNTIVEGANLKEDDPNSFLGRSVILYFKPTEEVPEKSSRIACGVIKAGQLTKEQVEEVYPETIRNAPPPNEKPKDNRIPPPQKDANPTESTKENTANP